MAKQTITVGDKTYEGERIDFEPVKEQWNEYKLSNGWTVRTRVVAEVMYVTEETNEAGDPIVVVGSHTMVSVSKGGDES